MHRSVLLNETMSLLLTRPDGFYIDATANGGGHAREIACRLGPGGRLLLTDADPGAIVGLKKIFEGDGRVVAEKSWFSDIPKVLEKHRLGPAEGVLADLGISSVQLDDPDRGFSFRKDAPLDMRFNRSEGETAAEFINSITERDLEKLLVTCGEGRGARRLARHLIRRREEGPIETTGQLEQVVVESIGRFYRGSKIHPATKFFMGLRIAVNRELEELESLLGQLETVITPGGRAAIISFHSLEDRMVKQAFVGLRSKGWEILTRKPVVPSDGECRENPRSRSAKLRVIERPLS